MVLEKPYEVVYNSWIFVKKKIFPKNWENEPEMGQKHGFLNLLKRILISMY